jgi:hypothetical protein
MNKLNETDKAYIAGFFDGEGCISISKYQREGRNKTPVYSLQVVIAQKGVDVLHDLQFLTGVGALHERHKYHPGTYEWRLSPNDALDFLTEILPYLRGKHQEALIAIEYQNKQGNKNHKGKGYIVPVELVQEKDSYYLKLQELKGTSSIKRGRPRKKIS